MDLPFEAARKMLEASQDPLIFYHDDPDGLCSFLILMRHLKRGHGHMVKASPYLTADFLRKVEEHKADLIIVVDIAHIEDDFIAKAGCPILWIDHHGPNEKKGTLYLNPMLQGENVPASWITHELTGTDEWLGMAGSVSDWIVPPGIEKYQDANPGLFHEPYIPEHLLFDTPLGTLIKVLSFNLKGAHEDVRKSINCLLKVQGPQEILDQSSGPGAFLWKKYAKMNREYEQLLKEADSQRSADEFLIYLYHDSKTSLTKDLANEVYARHPDKTTLLGREKNGKVMFSLRSKKNLPPALEHALAGLEGKGGGHEHACGGWIVQEHFPEMLKRLRERLE